MSEFSSGALALMSPQFSGKNRVICAFREIARIVAKRNNLCADVDSILFIVDETTEKCARTASDISSVPQLWHDVIFQMTLRRFHFVVKFYNVNLESLKGNAKAFAALLYHELRHVKENAKTGELYLDKMHEIEDWSELVKYGDWENDSSCAAMLPDLMSEKIRREGLV